MSTCALDEFHLAEARTAADMVAARRLFRAYADWLGVDLCFQSFEAELAELPGMYAPPDGRILLAKVGAKIGGEVAGCVGLRQLEPGICEMKRLWVEPGFGGRGIGRALVEAIIEEARRIGYQRMRLDTLPKLHAARHLYVSFGFRQIPDYYHNPLDGVVMMELDLRRGTSASPR